jgi:hypothetical protein
MADAGVLAQQGNQGAIRGVEHRFDQSGWQIAENYLAFRQLVYGVLHSFAIFSSFNRGPPCIPFS